MQQSVHIVLPRTLVCLVNPELFVFLFLPQRLQVGVSPSNARQPALCGQGDFCRTDTDTVLGISYLRAIRNVCQLSVSN